jgi:hypothetical protein
LLEDSSKLILRKNKFGATMDMKDKVKLKTNKSILKLTGKQCHSPADSPTNDPIRKITFAD